MEEKITAKLDELRVGLQADGGDAELVDVDGDKVTIRMKGKCASCAIANKTIELWVEAKLRERVSPAITVSEIK